MKMNEEEMKTKEEEEEEHLTRFHLQVKKKTETLLGPCGVCKGVRGVRAVGESVRSPCGVRGVCQDWPYPLTN